MRDVINITNTSKIKTIIEKYPMEQANQVLFKLKKSQLW